MIINRTSCFAQQISYLCLCVFLTIGNTEWAEASENGRLRFDQDSADSTIQKKKSDSFKSDGVARVSSLQISTDQNVFDPNPPELCAGHGELISFLRTDWETGLPGSWSVGTHDVASPSTFDTDFWAVVGTLPDSRPGKAAFVANLDSGDCVADDETGALFLDSPSIPIPAGAQVPRIAFDHWVDTEFGWDGGNIKISINGGGFNLIPSSAIEFNPYNSTLILSVDGNSNPLAGEAAFTGPENEGQASSWGQTQISLFGIAEAGDTIRLRFDFGVDGCGGFIGWYVDEVEVYSCSAELPPSNCGNGVIDAGEQCDDGNTFINDGCSNTCQVEDGWQCTAPLAPGEILDPSFEDGTPNAFWTEASTNYGSPICHADFCNTDIGSGPADGSYWVWLGGSDVAEEGSVSQSVVIPITVGELRFEFEASLCDSAADYVELLIDNNQVFFVDGSSPLCGLTGYTRQSVDISAYADGTSHNIEFHSETFANNFDVSNFFVDLVSLPGTPSLCTSADSSLTLKKVVINDSGGTAKASDWTLIASGTTGFSGSGPSVSSGVSFTAGTYNLTESGLAGYSASDWVCVGGTQNDVDTITLVSGESATCTITNNDISPTLTVVKTVINDNGGTMTDPNAFGLKVDNGIVLHNVSNAFNAGNHIVSEDGLAGYQPGSWGGDCGPNGAITLALGDVATCTISNDDISPTLTVVKTIVNDNGGTVTDPNVFGLRVDGGSVQHNASNIFNAGSHTVSEDGLVEYEPGFWGGDCNPNGTITLAPGQDATCVITNDDIDFADFIFKNSFE